MWMQIWRLNSTAQSKHSEKAVADLVNEFTNSLALLRAGDPVRPLFMPVTDEVEARFSSVQAHWKSKRGIWSGKSSPDIDQALACSRMAINPQGFFNTCQYDQGQYPCSGTGLPSKTWTKCHYAQADVEQQAQ